MKKIIFSLALFAATAAKANVIRVRRALLTGPIIQIEPADSEKKHPKVSEQIVIFNQIFDFLKKYPKFQTRTFNKEKFYLLNLMRLEVQKDAHKCSISPELLDDLVEKLPLREIYKKKSLSFKMAGGIGLASVVAHIVSRVKDSEVGCILSFIGLMSSLGIVAGSSYKAKKDKKKCVFKLWDDIEKSVKEGKTDLA